MQNKGNKSDHGYFILPKDYKFTLNAMPRGRILDHNIQNSCKTPYNTITIDANGNCLLCDCDGWLPIPVGNVLDFNSIEEVFDSKLAKIIQKDVDDKKFTWCAVNHCGIRNHNIKVRTTTYTIIINIDDSCNLACPSCRRSTIMHTIGELFERKIKQVERVLTWLEKSNNPVHIITSGSGDPLASLIMRPLIKNWKTKKDQTIHIKTNGLLVKKQLANLPIIESASFSISVDAASKDVYEKVRLGGKWEVLIENLEYLSNNNIQTELNFALQRDNYQDLTNFVSLCEKYRFWGTVHQLDDWATWGNREVLEPDEWTIKHGYFDEHNVLNKEHPNFNECKDILHNIKSEYAKLSPAVQHAIRSN